MDLLMEKYRSNKPKCGLISHKRLKVIQSGSVPDKTNTTYSLNKKDVNTLFQTIIQLLGRHVFSDVCSNKEIVNVHLNLNDFI